MEFALVNLGDNLPLLSSGRTPSDAEKHAQLVEQAVAAEAAGFDVFLLGEHHFNHFTISAPFAVLVAEAAATLDVLSGGRAEIGVGRGIHQGIYAAMGRPVEQASEILEEGTALLARLLTEQAVTWSGRWRPPLENITIRPRPVQSRIPLWAGSTSALELCAELELPCMWVATVYPYDKLAPVATSYRDAWAAAGRREADLELGIGVHCHVGATTGAARKAFRPHFAAYFEASANIEKSNLKRRVQPTARDLTLFDDVPFCGSAEQIVDTIGAARDLLGLTRMALVVDLGGMAQRQVLDQIAMLGSDVLPAFTH